MKLTREYETSDDEGEHLQCNRERFTRVIAAEMPKQRGSPCQESR